MRTQPKSQEVIQAQIASFAQDSLDLSIMDAYKNPQRREVFDAIGELAAGAAVDYSFERDGNHEGDANSQLTTLNNQSTVPVANYVNYLRQNHGARAEQIQNRAQYLTAYADFRPDVASVLQAVQDPFSRQNDPNFLDKGSNASVFTFEHDGEEYVAKIPHGQANPKEIDARMDAIMPGKGISHLEQLAAASYEDGVMVSKRLPGENFNHVTLAEISLMSEEQMQTALATFQEAFDAGINFESKSSNYMYDVEQGFGFVDYARATEDNRQSVDRMATQLGAAFAMTGLHREHEYLSSPEAFAAERLGASEVGALLRRYLKVCEDSAGKYGLAGSLKAIQERITVVDAFIKDNPDLQSARARVEKRDSGRRTILEEVHDDFV